MSNSNNSLKDYISDIMTLIKDGASEGQINKVCEKLSEDHKGVPVGLAVLEAIRTTLDDSRDELENAVKRGDEFYDQLENLLKEDNSDDS